MNEMHVLENKNAVILAGLQSAALANDSALDLPALFAGLNSITELDNPIQADLIKRCNDLSSEIDSTIVDSTAMAQIIMDTVREASTLSKMIESRRMDITRYFDNAKGAVMGWTRPLTNKLDAAEKAGKDKFAAFQLAERQREAAEQRKRQAEADAERARLQATAAEEAAKAQAKADELKQQAAAAAAAGDAAKAARLEARADTALEKGEDKAAELQQQAATTVAHIVSAPAKIKGAGMAMEWKARLKQNVTEAEALRALVKCIDANPQYINLICFNESAATKLAKALGSAMAVDGVEAYQVPKVSSRGRAA